MKNSDCIKTKMEIKVELFIIIEFQSLILIIEKRCLTIKYLLINSIDKNPSISNFPSNTIKKYQSLLT